MRKRRTDSGVTLNAIAGTHVVYMGLDLSATARKKCLGFAVQREDHTEDEVAWLRGMKTFEATGPSPDPGVTFSSREHPFQSFQWADYAAKPDHEYTYTIVPLYGTPASLTEGTRVSVRLHTETEWGSPHSVFFNRGAVASQEYARRFQNRRPSDVGEVAYEWLSRGLKEALLAFIARAEDATFSVHGAVYEFQWPEILEALGDAKKSGAKVQIIFDAIPGASGPAKKNKKAIAEAKVKGLTIERRAGKLMHNKFFVLSKNDKPVAVWTGSTNLTENGIFGHSNCGHAVEGKETAQAYLDYWNVLRGDPETSEMKDWTEANNEVPPLPGGGNPTPVFSPHRGLGALEWYAELCGQAKQGLFMTFAFGMHKKFQAVYEQADEVLRFALMEKEGNGAGLAQGKKDIRRIRARPNVVVAVGNNLKLNAFDRWLKEIDRVTPAVHVRWIHTKYMLVDPLGAKPIVVTGSANFSEASTHTNDENMIVIRDDRRVADIYLGEFMRLHAHYAFREAVAISLANNESFLDWQPKYLIPDPSWQQDYFTPKHARFLRREYFAGG